MKNFLPIKKIFLILIFGIFATSTFAQFDDIANFMQGGTNDAQKLFQAYLTPYANILGTDLNGGWYNSAKPHSKLGFDITLTTSMAFAPVADKEFDINGLNLESLTLAAGESNMTPTAAGKRDDGSRLEYNYTDPDFGTFKLADFKMPKGTGIGAFPLPMVKAGVGLFYKTEIMARYMPTVKLGDASMGLWGVGVKHSLKQWIPFLKALPIWNLSVMGGYTKLSTNADISFQPSIYGNDVTVVTTQSFDNQKLDLTFTSYTANLVASANLPIICVYAGVGISSTSTDLQLKGNYPILAVETDLTNPNRGKKVIRDSEVIKDPIDMSIDNVEGATLPRYNIGARLKFAVVTFHVDYTYANYSMVTAGIGISLR